MKKTERKQKNTEQLQFPFLVPFKPTPAKKTALTISEFIELLENEEEYYPDDLNNTKLMITRLRKIFYDKGGWNKKLIRGASQVDDRYSEKFVLDPNDPPYEVDVIGLPLPFSFLRHFTVVHKTRVTICRKGDRDDLEEDMVPEIYANGNQEVTVENNAYYNDIGHLLCGLDAYNYPAPVTPLPAFLSWAYKLLPNIENNMDAVTWVGDIASVAGEFLFATSKHKRPLTYNEKQVLLDEYAPGQDMLGNIDAYVIPQIYDITGNSKLRVTEILKDYYLDIGIRGNRPIGTWFRNNRFFHFSKAIGLRNWNGKVFENEDYWKSRYQRQLRDATICYCLTRSTGIGRFAQAFATWMGNTKSIIDISRLVELFLSSLKSNLEADAIKAA